MASLRVEVCEQVGFSGTPYRPIARIGGGSSSEVFEAEGPGGVRCAVKVLRALYAGAEEREVALRLEQEARALASLRHPNIVPVLDAGTTADGRPYFTMPRLTGETLRHRMLGRGPMAPATACALFAGVLGGLDAAHAAGIVHRDVKPANIFIATRPGALGRRPLERCVLLDFGIAKIAGAQRDLTTDAHVIGTPRYLAPEQILGGLVDARTDVYAAGIVLFEMISGRCPFDGDDDMDAMRAHLEAEPLRLRALAPVSHELEHVILRAMSRSPGRRWPSARAFAAVLARAATPDRGAEAAR